MPLSTEMTYHFPYNEKYEDNKTQTLDTIKKLERENEKLQDEIQESNNNNKYKLLYENLQKKYKGIEEQHLTKIESQEQITNQLQQSLEELNVKNNNLHQKNLNLEKQLENLIQQNGLLEEETQTVIGVATNYSLNVDEQDRYIKLYNDISSLQYNLECYVTNFKFKTEININELKKLLDKYGCQTKIFDKELNKPLIRAVLQRHVLEEIINQANFYFTRSNNDDYLESEIVSQTKVLTKLMETLQNNRLGDNEITRLTLIRLRQQVYTALDIRGFNDKSNSDGGNSKHNFIVMISKKINEMMNRYRIIKDIVKKNQINALAEDLVRNVIRIFYFRLLIQEPIAQYRWFDNNEKINKSFMKGDWDEDEAKDMVVEVCSFPIIYKRSHANSIKVLTHSKVFPRIK
ncbi:hypothetical protein C1645_789125 [Glomus cerebriforme]|uniref:Uncharacterized protein n=1 Tax=Glomus cerebriforme TaxID=658196 RepID=A0A397SHU5_9GLOM|nr:hypothetical protein C1645_789125 [Glomus cerebriforme]